jgi:hypothetical protein
MTIDDIIIETAIQAYANTRDAVRWAIQQEREGCANLIENECHDDMTRAEEAAAIRARGE